ncbi:hypothetical protein HMPREF1372_00427 [Enterococcus faecium P1139]|nr:hypothetical protein HMPREF1372_00427 [Enterococcus faecium P1139]
MFYVWLSLLPQMQAFEHRLFEKKKGAVTRLLSQSPYLQTNSV